MRARLPSEQEFEGFRNMFTLLGGVLCAITGLVGMRDFFQQHHDGHDEQAAGVRECCSRWG